MLVIQKTHFYSIYHIFTVFYALLTVQFKNGVKSKRFRLKKIFIYHTVHYNSDA